MSNSNTKRRKRKKRNLWKARELYRFMLKTSNPPVLLYFGARSGGKAFQNHLLKGDFTLNRR